MLIYRGGVGNQEFGLLKYNNMRPCEFGFGKLQKDFWLGLKHMHHFTYQAGDTELLVELVRNGTKLFAHYNKFSVGARSDGYRLTVGGYKSKSTLPDSLSHSNGFEFAVYYEPEAALYQYGGPGGYYRSCNEIFLLQPSQVPPVPNLCAQLYWNATNNSFKAGEVWLGVLVQSFLQWIRRRYSVSP